MDKALIFILNLYKKSSAFSYKMQIATSLSTYLNEANEDFKLALELAKKDNFDIRIISSFRSFQKQKRIWKKLKTKRQLRRGHCLVVDVACCDKDVFQKTC